MKAEVEIAMRMILIADTSVPPDGRIDKAIDILRGLDREGDDVVRMKEICSLLHMSPAAVRQLMKEGKLTVVMGSGNKCIGTSRESLSKYIKGEIRLKDGTLLN